MMPHFTVALAVLAYLPVSLSAQQVRGVVANVETFDRLNGASLLLLDSTRAVVDLAESDSTGGFELASDHSGPHTLLVYRAGFNQAESESLNLTEGLIHELRVNLVPAFMLGTIEVTARRERSGAARQFARRKELGLSIAFDRLDLDRIQPYRLDDVLRLARGARVVGRGRRSFVALNHRRCRPVLVIDGRQSPLGSDEFEGLSWDWVVGIEVFPRRTSLPSDINPPFSATDCGVVAVWTIWTR